jgi:hypothetical protein
MNNNERILSHKMSQKLSTDEINNISAAGKLSYHYTYLPTGQAYGHDSCMDIETN